MKDINRKIQNIAQKYDLLKEKQYLCWKHFITFKDIPIYLNINCIYLLQSP